jgi:hypothetical protein
MRPHLHTRAALATLFASAPAASQQLREFQAQAAQIVDAAAWIVKQQPGSVSDSTTSRPAPDIQAIRDGDRIQVFDRSIKVRFIRMMENPRDVFIGRERIAAAGTLSCTAFERPADMPTERVARRAWIHIRNCVPQ